MLVSFFCKPLWVPFNRFRERVQSGHLMRREVVAYYSSCPSLWFLVAPHPAPLCCRSFSEGFVLSSEELEGMYSKKERLKVPFGERACIPEGGKLPGRSQPAAMGNSYLHNQARWKSRASSHDAMGGGVLGLRGSPHSITAREEEHRGRPRR